MADRQTCNQILWLKLKAIGTLDRHAHQGCPKSTPHIFCMLTNLDCFDREIDSQTNRQVDRYILLLELTDLITLSVDGLSPNLSLNCLKNICCI